jgi:DNA-binding MarR family transcriptional regulator
MSKTLDSVDRLVEQWRKERPELDVSSLALAVRIDMIAKLLRRDTARSLAREGLKTWEYDVLSALRRHGPPYKLPATVLAKASLLTSGAMTTRIDHLEKQGLVRRKRDPDDRRGVQVVLTRKGLRVIDDAIQARLEVAKTSAERLSPTERAAVEGGLRKLLLALSPAAELE